VLYIPYLKVRYHTLVKVNAIDKKHILTVLNGLFNDLYQVN
jgi:hypothetical protein